jgi:fructose-bisphosphate aldolase class II
MEECVMGLVPMSELLERAAAQGYAVPAFSAWNMETAEAVLRVAHSLRAPVILMAGPGELVVLRAEHQRASVQHLLESYPVPAALHLDHGGTMEEVDACLRAGYTSVMLDCSTLPFEENAAALREVVARAHPLGVTVEGEIGHVGRVDGASPESDRGSVLTDPEEAAAYVEATGVDALAIAIGNAHGQYTRLPRLDFDRLAAIRERTHVPLVLHGGSGTPEPDLRRAISLGIAKVNVATDLVTAYRQSLLEQWNAGRNQWVPFAIAEALQAYAGQVEAWIRRLGAAGRT